MNYPTRKQKKSTEYCKIEMTVQFSITEVKSIIKPEIRFVAKAVRLQYGGTTEDRESRKNMENMKTQKAGKNHFRAGNQKM